MNKYQNMSVALLTLFLSVTAYGSNQRENELVLKKGDVIIQQNEDKSWNTIKVLEIDSWPDNTQTAHCLTYKPSKTKPSFSALEGLEILAYHAPIDAASFTRGWEVIANQPPQKEELVGFFEYLKLTDFRRYAKETNQDLNALISEANSNYKKAYSLGSQKKHKEALVYYSKAIDLFPLFFEAIDNRGFTHMDLGNYEKALQDFDSSLRVHPEGLTAFFSRGECLLYLGRYSEAIEQFSQGANRFPEKKSLFDDFVKKSRALQKAG